MSSLISLRNVTVFRGDKRALDGLTLSIGLDEHVAIIGPNGCGKSTLVRTIARDFYPVYGDGDWSLSIMGQDTWHVFELRSMLGIVTNDMVAACTCSFPLREIVLSGFFSSVGVWPHHEVTPAMERRTSEILKFLEIEHLAGRPTNQLSSGEARRAVIGRALVHEPKALLLDEPSTSLDLRAQRELRETMRKLAQHGHTLVLVTHHLPDLIPEMKRVILMDKGRVWREGPVQAMLSHDNLKELFGVDLDIVERDGYFNVW
jgi:iron complex transport system ATP-binding protein